MIHPKFTRFAAVFGIAALLMSIGAATANADSTAIYQACSNETSLSGFSKQELTNALANVPADVDEYSSCSGKINKALVDLATKDLPGGKSTSVKSTKHKLQIAGVKELTTPAERKKLRAQVADATKVDSDSKPLSSNSDPAISTAAGNTLASSTAPGTPTALIIGVIGLLLLLGADLAGRLGKMPRVKKYLPRSGPRDDN